MQVLDQRHRGERHLAEPERVERSSCAEVVHQVVQAPQVHRVLREAAGPEHAHGDRERLVGRDPGVDESSVHLGELGPAEHLVHRDDASGELAEPARGQPADEVLGEHREALLGLLVTGQTAGQDPELLVRAVDEGDDVGADFVVQQRFGPRRRDPGGGRDEHVAVGHHHPGASHPNLDVRLDVGGERPVSVQLGLRELHERVGIEPRARIGWWRRHGGEDGLGFVQEGGGDGAVLLDAQREELGRTTTRQHLHQEQQLTMLRLPRTAAWRSGFTSPRGRQEAAMSPSARTAPSFVSTRPRTDSER